MPIYWEEGEQGTRKKNKTNNRKNTFGTKKLVIMLGSMLAKREGDWVLMPQTK